MSLFNIVPYNKCTELKSTYGQRQYWKLVANNRFQNSVYNYQSHWVPNKTQLKILQALRAIQAITEIIYT